VIESHLGMRHYQVKAQETYLLHSMITLNSDYYFLERLRTVAEQNPVNSM
jgi:hypothetical protein